MKKQAVFHSAGDDMPMSNMVPSCSPSVGLHLTDLQYLHLRALILKKKPGVSNKDISVLNLLEERGP